VKLVPIRYPMRSVTVRWRSSLFSAAGIACTVAVICGILALRTGFMQLYTQAGSDDIIVYMRPGATSEGSSGIRLEQARILKNERAEIQRGDDGRPLAAAEVYLAINVARIGGGTTNVPIRGIEDATVAIQGDAFRLVEGRMLVFGSDEIVVGAPVSGRIENCRVGDTMVVNITPFKVVGVFEHDGAYSSEIWGDVDRVATALQRPHRNRVVARLRSEASMEDIRAELEQDKRVPAMVMTEREYLDSQKDVLGTTFTVLAVIIGGIMAIAAVLGATTNMLASIGSRSSEVGILLSLGFSRLAIFLTFVVESLLIGMIGGIAGAFAVIPFDGLETGTTNFQTFTEVSFAFTVTPSLLSTAMVISVFLGLIGGVVPSWRASRMVPTDALRRG